MKKKGVLLLEAIVYLFFLSMFIVKVTDIFLPHLREYKENSNSSKVYKYLLNAESYINSRLNESKINSLTIKENKIIINIDNKFNQIDIIRKNGDLLIVEYKKPNTNTTYNVILRNLENFNVHEKDKLIYVIIKQKGENQKVFCYGKT